ncbi:MAG: hypothetical protein IJP29_01640 [Lachnospiraceae bacterium]|nr:hypothetical protein [Lachnospiraceae bacterium]
MENPDLYNVTVYHVDGGIIYNESNMAKCDYLYVVDDEMHPSAIFIELKGKNIHHAMQQLHSTMMQFSSEFKQYRKYARIICSAVPRIANDPNTLKLMKEMKKQNIDINMQEHSMSEDYSTLV